jgi:AcrR family transcriptional regulator
MTRKALENSVSTSFVPSDEQGQRPKVKESRKTRYTKQVIREVFIQLLHEQPLEKVTVTRICELADISRGTFYLHYRDPYHVLECMESEFLFYFEQHLEEKKKNATSDYWDDSGFWLDILIMLSSDKELTQLFFTNPNSVFVSKCLALNRNFSYELCKREYPDMSDQEREYVHAFYEQGSASVICLWVRNGFREPPEKIARYLVSLNLKQRVA